MTTALYENGKILRNGSQTALIADDDSVIMQWISPRTRICIGEREVPQVHMSALGQPMAAYLPCTVGTGHKLLHLAVFPALAVFSYFFLWRVTMAIGLCTVLEVFLAIALFREYIESRVLLILLHNGLIVGRGGQWKIYSWVEIENCDVDAAVVKERRFTQNLRFDFVDGSNVQIVTHARVGTAMAGQAMKFANLASTAVEMSKREE